MSKINSSSVSNLNADIIRSLPIPIPPLAEQKRIVAILDKFDALTNSITEGLPREIELRKQQYEYYREMLLSFQDSPSSVEGVGNEVGRGSTLKSAIIVDSKARRGST